MTSSAQKVTFEVAADDAGLRLDQLLAKRVDGLSRRKARVLLDIGGVFVDRARCKVASRQVRPGQVVEAHLGGALERATKEVGGAARARDERRLPAFAIALCDDDVVVVDKPAGLLTAPTPESDRGNLADALARQLGAPGAPAPLYVVHRLDLGTSGLLIFARTEGANRTLAERFRVHDVRREYLAVVAGALRADELTVEEPVAGRRAVTHLAVLERLGDDATLLRARLETGRTHQIRIHCRHLGHPVLGDRRYGDATAIAPPRMALHAARLGVAHPRTGAPIDLESPLPSELCGWLDELRRRTS